MRWHLLKRGCLGYLGAELGHKEEDQPVSPVRLHRCSFVSFGRLRRRGERCWGRRTAANSGDHVGERVLFSFLSAHHSDLDLYANRHRYRKLQFVGELVCQSIEYRNSE